MFLADLEASDGSDGLVRWWQLGKAGPSVIGCAGRRGLMGVDVSRHVYMCIDMSVDMSVGTCIDMIVEMRKAVRYEYVDRRVYRYASESHSSAQLISRR